MAEAGKMKDTTYLVEDDEKGQRAYRALKLNPKRLNVLNSDLAQQILSELSKKPSCAMDVARRLKQHEQKIYYHLRRLEDAGIVTLDRTESRVGATAKIYSVTHPYLAIKLFDGEPVADMKTKARELDFFKPFIDKGGLDATIVVGSPDPHGKYGVQALDGSVGIDLALFLGTFLKSAKPNYKLDTEVTESDLRGNLIVIGGPKANIIIDKFNPSFPVYFDQKHEFNLVSGITKNVYSGDDVGLVVMMRNPLSKPQDGDRHILVLSGIRFKGTRAAIIALVKHMKMLLEKPTGTSEGGTFVAHVVRGIDRDADGRIDDVEFLE
jgi:DNA-binding transcriptional ArsR family regulator